MSSNPEARFHLTLAGIWIGCAIWMAISIAVAVGSKTALERRRGADFKARCDLATEQKQLRAEIDWLASAPSLENAVQRLSLPIAPPARLATR